MAQRAARLHRQCGDQRQPNGIVQPGAGDRGQRGARAKRGKVRNQPRLADRAQRCQHTRRGIAQRAMQHAKPVQRAIRAVAPVRVWQAAEQVDKLAPLGVEARPAGRLRAQYGVKAVVNDHQCSALAVPLQPTLTPACRGATACVFSTPSGHEIPFGNGHTPAIAWPTGHAPAPLSRIGSATRPACRPDPACLYPMA